jgi:cyanophycinase-like exopeptidase
MAGLIVIMGSGETAPTMVKPHRAIFERVGQRPAILLDTPYGFQSNADDISARAVGYFRTSVGRDISVVSWRRVPSGLDRERALAAVREAGWVFAGPGSPTYTLRQWRDTPMPGAITGVLDRDGVVVFASAAALTFGSHAIPVYEIYKAGIDPYWEPGLDLIRQATGVPAVVIPHFDNAEGGNHDTRFCYLGEARLSTMERSLPDDAVVLGVDEHTAVLLDLGESTATVVGNGTMTLRRRGRAVGYPSGCVLTFDQLAAADLAGPADLAAAGAGGTGRPQASRATVRVGAAGETAAERLEARAATSLRAAADLIAARFDTALGRRDVDGCVAAILDLEQALLDWSADTLTSDEGDHARGQLRRMVLRLGELAVLGAQDPRAAIGPFVTDLLELRTRARAARDFATSDWIRDRLGTAGVEVRDTPDGAEWVLAEPTADGR